MSYGVQPRSWRNRGRMTPAHWDRLETLSDRLAFPDAPAAVAWAPTVLDIGFGSGESLVALARSRPDDRILGVDVHPPGLLHALDALVAEQLDGGHARILDADAIALLPLLPPASLTLIQGFHPDPWPKRRHANRRLFGPLVLARLAQLLRPGGVLHLVTDDDSYARAIRSAVAALPQFQPLDHGLLVPPTKYGRRAVAQGRQVHDMAWTRLSDSCQGAPSDALRGKEIETRT